MMPEQDPGMLNIVGKPYENLEIPGILHPQRVYRFGTLGLALATCCVLAAGLPESASSQSVRSLRQELIRPNATPLVAGRSASIEQDAIPSSTRALALSFVLPGLGQRYVGGGRWGGWGTTFALADVGLWLSLFGSEWHRNQIIDSYTTLAAMGADADVAGKDRTFFLNLASYRSSEAYLETVLRNRAWEQVDYVSDPAYQWHWTEEVDFVRYRALREDAETLRRRRVVIIASLVANRLISGVMAAWRAASIRTETLSVALEPPPGFSSFPRAIVKLQF